MSEMTHFRGLLPPQGAADRFANLPPSKVTPGALILHALNPLRAELDAALARDDRPAALRLTYTALSHVVEALAAYRGDALRPDQVRVHALRVELETLPLAPLADGTLAEGGTVVSVSYRHWKVDRFTAAAWAQTLTERFQTLWPGAWVVTPDL